MLSRALRWLLVLLALLVLLPLRILTVSGTSSASVSLALSCIATGGNVNDAASDVGDTGDTTADGVVEGPDTVFTAINVGVIGIGMDERRACEFRVGE